MGHEATREKISDVGARVNSLLFRAITAAVVLVIFIGLAFLVYVGRVESGALLLYAGVIIGYLIHATQQAV